jgi:hypothetical protein
VPLACQFLVVLNAWQPLGRRAAIGDENRAFIQAAFSHSLILSALLRIGGFFLRTKEISLLVRYCQFL